MSDRHKSTHNDAPTRKGSKSTRLKLNTSFLERESRPYSSGPPREPPQQSASRPATAKRSKSKAEKPEPMVRHSPGHCQICDFHGYHKLEPSEAQKPLKEKSIPPSPFSASQQPSQQVAPTAQHPEASKSQSRPNRRQSYHEQRPTSFHDGMSYSALPLQPFSASDWNMLPTPLSAYPQTPYVQTPVLPFIDPYEQYAQSLPSQYNQQALPPLGPRPPEPRRRTSSRAEPIIQQSPIVADKPPLGRTRSHRETQRARDPSTSRQEDAKRMPPPQVIPVRRRPNIAKANTTISTPLSDQRERGIGNDGPAHARLSSRERKSDPPPSSYREPPLSSYHNSNQNRPVPPKSKSYTEAKHTSKVNSTQSGLDRPTSILGAELNEMRAEAYQKSRGTNPQPLTIDAISKIERRSDSGSQYSINTSSRGSTGGKTKTTLGSNDITLMMHGVTLGISADSAENRSIKIEPRGNGDFNISVKQQESSGRDNKALSLLKRSGSTTSSSKQSRRSSEKEVRRSRDQSLDREPERAPHVSSWSSKASYDDSFGYDLAYG
ncbi:hypothetical protein EPUS_04726 [Endocarpon pusillum Z07020]|uniref:Uncharacterized protein n=1 Tax=Endocarpon pusillum (strain Z07020 / HMAS-L-300199) TaxID=1263415 RepID=U1GEC9_ENDPU|nr:uncharacterized protein EPUS_04726 [Endocarpon pusillum Z07020]ERF70448.1 hypothetical protein EPUS_04726 [Endocarpon pusillum Z07020]